MRMRAWLAAFGMILPLAMASAVPVPEDRPESPPKARAVDVTGTSWEGSDGTLGFVRVTFEPNGVLCYVYKNGQTIRTATWQQQGGVVTFVINNFRHFRGTINNDTLAGDSWNQAGTK